MGHGIDSNWGFPELHQTHCTKMNSVINRSLLPIVAFLLLAGSIGWGKPQGESVQEIVRKRKALYATTKGAKITFQQTGAGAGTINGTLVYGEGNRYTIEFLKQTLVSNGTTTWTWNRSANQVVISKTASGGGRLTPNDILRSFPGDYATELKGSDKVNKRDVWVVRCTPRGSNTIGDVTEAILYIDKKTYRFQQVAVTSPSLGKATIRIVSANYNLRPPASTFTFQPPKGAQVIDLSR